MVVEMGWLVAVPFLLVFVQRSIEMVVDQRSMVFLLSMVVVVVVEAYAAGASSS